MSNSSGFPIRYSDGSIINSENDLDSGGFGLPWGHTRVYGNQLTSATGGAQGNSWVVPQLQYLSFVSTAEVSVVRSVNDSLWFKKPSSDWEGEFSIKATLTPSSDKLVLLEPLGTKYTFNDNSAAHGVKKGLLTRITTAGGAQADITYNSDGNAVKFEQSSATQSVVYEYAYHTGVHDKMLESVTLKVDGENVRRVVYSYYGASEGHGNLNDLKKAVISQWDDGTSAWGGLRTKYYRYYKSGEAKGVAHGMKFNVDPEAWDRMVAAGLDPEAATDTEVGAYAAYQFEYDTSRRVTMEKVKGGSQTYDFAYGTESGFADAYDNWKYKTTEERLDGSEVIVYSNYAMEPILKVIKDGNDEWYTYVKYDPSSGKALQIATSAAVQSYDDTQTGSGFVTLKADTGLVTNKKWYTSTDEASGSALNYLEEVSVQEGSGGTPVKLRGLKYTGHTVGSDTVFEVDTETIYRSDTGDGDPVATTFDYEYHTGTLQVKEREITLPVIATGQNGDGQTYWTYEIYDLDGRVVWSKDELGVIDHSVYDQATGAMVQSIRDVDTTITPGSPWNGAGDNLITDYQFDLLGRTTQVLGPEHTIDIDGTAKTVRRAEFTVYRDDIREVWSARGYADGTAPGYGYTTVNPVSITKMDAMGRTTDEVRAGRGTGVTSGGRLSAADTFPQSSWLRWSASEYDQFNRLVRTREYFDILDSGDGLNGTNYIQTEFGYDTMDRQNRVEGGEGTITGTLYDVRGQVTKTWVGTDDSGATEANPGGDPNEGSNMKLVIQNTYDGGDAGGNGLLTSTVQFVSEGVGRTTGFDYDWRDRQTGVDGEENTYTKTDYNNQGQPTVVEQRHSDVAGTLLGKSETVYDDLGRAYQSKVHGVNSSGTVTNVLVSNTWRDGAGRVIKQSDAGSGVSTKTVYDSLGRPTTAYLSAPQDGTEVNTNNVDADIVVEQTETDYDAASNVTAQRTLLRFHDAPVSGAGSMGALNPPGGANPKARRYNICSWPDALGREQATANYGTNGGSAVTRPDTIPSSTETRLVSSVAYDAAGQVEATTDAAGTVNRSEYDGLGRQTATVENDTGGAPTADSDKRTEFSYNLDGNLTVLTCKNRVTGDQVTRWVYGTAGTGSLIATTRLPRAKIYPDSDDATDPLADGADATSDRVEYEYNRAGEVTKKTDQNGTVHLYEYDGLGALTDDKVDDAGPGIDGHVMRISIARNERRLVETVTSHSAASGGVVRNEVGYVYNDFNQITEDRQEHGTTTSTSSPKVGYAYVGGSTDSGATNNNIRPTRTTYPDGRQIDPIYDAGMDDILSRPSSVKDVAEALNLAAYEYLGMATPVIATSSQPGTELTYVKQGSEVDGDAGDQYNGLDRFGRIQDQRWIKAAADIERVQYGYTQASLKQWRHNPVAAALTKKQDDYYDYDGLYQIKDRDRGSLNINRTAISGTPEQAEDWTYDPTGNWDTYQRKADGLATVDQTRTHNEANEIETLDGLSAPLAYDPAGNMTVIPIGEVPADGHYEATWDAWNRLVRLKTPGAGGSSSSSSSSSPPAPPALDVKYEYDGLTRRTRKNILVGSTTGLVDYYYNLAWKCVEQRRAGGNCPERQFVWGVRGRNDLVTRDRYYGQSSSSNSSCSISSKERHYALNDAMGSVTAISSAAGSIVERYGYTAFGQSQVMEPDFDDRSLSSYDWEVRFHGETRDSESGYYNYGYRYYLPELGRWFSRDPIGESGGLSLYAFVGNDGVNKWDLLGNVEKRPATAPPYFWEPGRPMLYVVTVFSRQGGKCGQHQVGFQVHLSHPAPEDGYVVQEINLHIQIWNCGPDGKKGKARPPLRARFWESWYVKKGATQAVVQERMAADPNPNRLPLTDISGKRRQERNCIGEAVTHGRFRFYPETTTGFLGGSHRREPGELAVPEALGWGIGNDPATPGHGISGSLPSTTVQPGWWNDAYNRPTESLWNDGYRGPTEAERSVSIKWNCCSGSNPTEVEPFPRLISSKK